MISSCRAKMRCHPRSHLAWQNEDLISVVVVYYADMIPGSCSDITCPDNVKIKAIWGSLDCRSVESLGRRPFRSGGQETIEEKLAKVCDSMR